MADSIVSCSKKASEETSTQIATDTDLCTDGLKINIKLNNWDCAEYTVTRAKLEAEDIVPADSFWPERGLSVAWKASELRYALHRTRVKGMRRPRLYWVDFDCWKIWFESLPQHDFVLRVIELKTRKLTAEIHRRSFLGQKEWEGQWQHLNEARRDEKSQAFMALLSGLIPPNRGCKTPSFQRRALNE